MGLAVGRSAQGLLPRRDVPVAALAFTWVSQLLGLGFDLDVPPPQIRTALREDRLYRVGMRLPGLGTVGLTFEGTPDAEAPAAGHPVLLIFEADEWGVPRFLWTPEDRTRAEERLGRVLRCLEVLCDRLDPAYAVVEIDEIAPPHGARP